MFLNSVRLALLLEIRKLFTCVVFIAITSALASAQVAQNCDNGCGGGTDPTAPTRVAARTSTTATRGLGSAIRVTSKVLSKTINVEGSRSFTYAIPILFMPGRGINTDLSLYYNSFIWTAFDSSIVLNADRDTPSYGFRLDYGFIELASDLASGALTEADGTKHPLALASTQPPNATRYVSTDSTYIQVDVPPGASVVATFKNGTVIYYNSYTSTPTLEFRPFKIEDTNGNIMSFTYANNSNLLLSTISDTLQRQERFIYDSTGTILQCIANALTCDAPGATVYRFAWNTYALNFNFSESTGSLQSGKTALNVLTDVTKPDGTSVHFSYGDWAIVNQVQERSATRQLRFSASYNFPLASAGTLSTNPTYTQETIFDGVNTGTWNYQTTTDPTTGMVTSFAITDPCGTVNTTTSDAATGLPAQIQVSSTSQSLPPSGCASFPTQDWQTIKQSWTSDGSGDNPRLANITTILDDNSQSQVTFKSYDTNGNPTDVLKYDFGAGATGALLEETITSYAQLANHILDRPSDVTIKDGADKVVFHKKLNYDEVPVQSLSPAPTFHDETNYSASSTLARGNLTSVTVYVDPVAGTGDVTSKFTYDEAGSLLTADTGSSTHLQRKLSVTTQYAFPDSVTVGPSTNQLLTSFTYDWFGRPVGSVDPNGQTTTLSYDNNDRIATKTTPEGVTTTFAYDNNSAHPSVSISSSANSLVTKDILDGRGRTIEQQILNGSILVSKKSKSYNIVGELFQSSNPYGPTESPLFTTYSYDPLGRITATTPPAVSGTSLQNSYQAAYSGAIVTMTDPALKKHKQYGDALGRLIRVDEPGIPGAASSSALLTISGTEQSASTATNNGATAGVATATIGGAERSMQVQTNWATKASVTVTVGGTDSTNYTTVNGRTFSVRDTGTIQFSVTAGGAVINVPSVSYNSSSTPASLAAGLFASFPSNSVVTMSNPNGSATFTLTTTATGSATNNSTISTGMATNCVDSDTVACSGPGWTMTLSGPNLAPTTASNANFSGGSDNAFTTVYDTGNVTIAIYVNSTVYSKNATYDKNSTPTSIANDLYNQFIADSAFNQLVRVNPPGSGGALQFTTVATGTNTNYPITTSTGTSSSTFAPGSSSFTITPLGSSNFTPGQNGTLYDVGTVTLTLNGFTNATPPSKQVSYGQGSTASGIAALMAAQIHSDPIFPLDATVQPGSATIALTARNQGADANNYSVSVSGKSSLSSTFVNPSFPNSPPSSASVTASLTGGADGSPSLDPSTVLSTYYSYDPVGNLLQVHQGKQTRTYAYDGLSRLISGAIPETANQPIKYSYTDFGAVAQRTDPRTLPGTTTNIITTYGYDALDRLQTITYNDGTPAVIYTYGTPGSANNTVGQVASVQVGPGSNIVETDFYQYDIMGRPTQVKKILVEMSMQ